MTKSQLPHFAGGGAFQAELQQRVHEYFEGSHRSRHGGPRIALKIAVMLVWLAGSWTLAMFAHPAAWIEAGLAVSIGLAMAGVGFSVMHDANHGATSASPRFNRILSLSLDLIGASSVLWRDKHNVKHHTYTNIGGADPDLEGGKPLLRLAPWQERRAWHRFQHLYVWILYAAFPLKWWFFDDLRDLRGRKARDAVQVLLGKGVFLGWAFILPAVLHPSWGLVGLWAVALATLGTMVGSIFQLAHCAAGAEFVQPEHVSGSWAQHQVATTVDFAPRNALLCWYLGGLNFQVEHHLFARVCHVHYPRLSAIVRETCQKHGLRYRCEPTLHSALASNVRWLKTLGARSA